MILQNRPIYIEEAKSENMKKVICTFVCMLSVLAAVPALQVNESELKTAAEDGISFQNYGGPHAVIETAAAITGIGTQLGQSVAVDVNRSATYRPEGKYTVIHAVGGDEPGKLDADIFVIQPSATVDHIRNVRRILSGFLTAAYGYTKDDADTIAVFITVYNAVYRNELSVFNQKYNAEVLKYLNREQVGLSTVWTDWAGGTQIVIPLGELDGGLSTIDTSVISNADVINSLREEDDKGIDVRSNMADIKAREAEDASEKARAAQKEAVQQRAVAAEAKKDADIAAAAAAADPDNLEKQQAAAEARQTAVEESKKAETASKNAEVQQQKADKKTLEVQTEQGRIVQDKKELAKAAGIDTSSYVTGLTVTDEKNQYYGLVTVDGDNGKIIRVSPVKQIRDTRLYTVSSVRITDDEGKSTVYDSLFMVLCGVNNKKSAVKLCLIDTESLELKKETAETVSVAAGLLELNGSYFAVIQSGKEWFAARFDKNLNLLNKSAAAVHAATAITIVNGGIMVTDKKGNPMVLSADDLSTRW